MDTKKRVYTFGNGKAEGNAKMRELLGGTVKVSVRSFNNIDAALFCKQFGGGGHMGAAGCEIKGDIYKAKQMIIKIL